MAFRFICPNPGGSPRVNFVTGERGQTGVVLDLKPTLRTNMFWLSIFSSTYSTPASLVSDTFRLCVLPPKPHLNWSGASSGGDGVGRIYDCWVVPWGAIGRLKDVL